MVISRRRERPSPLTTWAIGAGAFFVVGTGALGLGRLLRGDSDPSRLTLLATVSVLCLGLCVLLFALIGARFEARSRRAASTSAALDGVSCVLLDQRDVLGRLTDTRQVSKPTPRVVSVTQDDGGITIWDGVWRPTKVVSVSWEEVAQIESSSFTWGARNLPSIRVEVGGPRTEGSFELAPIGAAPFWLGSRGSEEVARLREHWDKSIRRHE